MMTSLCDEKTIRPYNASCGQSFGADAFWASPVERPFLPWCHVVVRQQENGRLKRSTPDGPIAIFETPRQQFSSSDHAIPLAAIRVHTNEHQLSLKRRRNHGDPQLGAIWKSVFVGIRSASINILKQPANLRTKKTDRRQKTPQKNAKRFLPGPSARECVRDVAR